LRGGGWVLVPDLITICCNCYSGKSAHKLSQQIFTDCPGLRVSHAMYLGVELQKAGIALLMLMKEELIYEQDKHLKIQII